MGFVSSIFPLRTSCSTNCWNTLRLLIVDPFIIIIPSNKHLKQGNPQKIIISGMSSLCSLSTCWTSAIWISTRSAHSLSGPTLGSVEPSSPEPSFTYSFPCLSDSRGSATQRLIFSFWCTRAQKLRCRPQQIFTLFSVIALLFCCPVWPELLPCFWSEPPEAFCIHFRGVLNWPTKQWPRRRSSIWKSVRWTWLILLIEIGSSSRRQEWQEWHLCVSVWLLLACPNARSLSFECWTAMRCPLSCPFLFNFEAFDCYEKAPNQYLSAESSFPWTKKPNSSSSETASLKKFVCWLWCWSFAFSLSAASPGADQECCTFHTQAECISWLPRCPDTAHWFPA